MEEMKFNDAKILNIDPCRSIFFVFLCGNFNIQY